VDAEKNASPRNGTNPLGFDPEADVGAALMSFTSRAGPVWAVEAVEARIDTKMWTAW
jgi:hypothetical protein